MITHVIGSLRVIHDFGPTQGLFSRFANSKWLFNANSLRLLGLCLLKIQFNGIGALLTYISLTPNADVSA
jgi:hypothetical protein